MNTEKDVVVFLESSGEKSVEINRGLLTEGNRIATGLGGSLSALIVGAFAEDQHILERFGASSLYQVGGAGLSQYSGEVFAWAAQEALRDIPFRLLLFAHTDRGSELAPRIGYYLGTGTVSGCADIRIKDHALSYVRYVYGGQFEQDVSYSGAVPEIATVRPEALTIREAPSSKPLRVSTLSVKIPPHVVGTTPLELTPPDFRTVDILYAKRIIAAGSGCVGPGLLSLVEELSHLLEGSVGTTRPVVDDGYLPKDRMIGRTGKTVLPELYVALGISGSPHHVAGVQASKMILAVNRDPRAPIFNVSDAGFVGDLSTLLPKLINRVKQYRDEGLA